MGLSFGKSGLFQRGGLSMDKDVDERLKKLEELSSRKDQLGKIEHMSIRVTSFVLLELALLALIIWSFLHLVSFLRSSAS
jgi:hypothetical protein